MLLIGTIAMALLAYPLVLLMHHTDPAFILAGQVMIAILIAICSGPLPALMTEMFPGRIRVCAVSIGYNLVYAVFGGTTPMVAVWLIKREHSDIAFVGYIIAAAIVSLIFVWNVKDKTGQPLEQ